MPELNDYFSMDSKVAIYGMGKYGLLLKEVLRQSGYCDIVFIDDFLESATKLENITSKNTQIAITISNEQTADTVIARVKQAGFENIIHTRELFKLLDNLSEKLTAGLSVEKIKTYPFKERRIDSKCVICGCDTGFVYENKKNFKIIRCFNCKHEFVENMPTKEYIADFYMDELYFESNYRVSIDNFYDERLYEKSKERYAHIEYFLCAGLDKSQKLNILEIGCLDGRFLAYLTDMGQYAVGCEVNTKLANMGMDMLGVKIETKRLEECSFENDSFDIIYSSHVIEHIDDLHSLLQKCSELLNKKGILVFHFPLNDDDYENFHHLHFFSEESCRILFGRYFYNYKFVKDVYGRCDGVLAQTITICASKNTVQSY